MAQRGTVRQLDLLFTFLDDHDLFPLLEVLIFIDRLLTDLLLSGADRGEVLRRRTTIVGTV